MTGALHPTVMGVLPMRVRPQAQADGGKGEGGARYGGSPYFVASATILATMTSSSLPISSRAATW